MNRYENCCQLNYYSMILNKFYLQKFKDRVKKDRLIFILTYDKMSLYYRTVFSV